MRNNSSKVLLTLFLVTISMMVIPFISSCGKQGTINPTESKIQYQVLNLSYDVLPVYLYVNFLKQGNTYSYPSASGYFDLNTIDTPFQIRSAATASVTNLLRIDSSRLNRNTKYSLYIVGTRKNNDLSYLFTVDTSTIPPIGKGKIRFVNAAPTVAGTSDQGLNLAANGTNAFRQQKYKSVSNYIEIPAGVYNFQVSGSNPPNGIIKELKRTTINDGGLYTLYTYGLAGRVDTAAFGFAILTNR
ncbi:hypothetical protein GCM10023149_36820 [Mucilaginibacter gynuensis]|uniref:DUF4397 domain-containing protein n=1 Tax=Mucilaginibacter gynuensis TaxID=1302236 RepID=A0ABP8GXC3_9SPHI